jgi:hypothetical protein
VEDGRGQQDGAGEEFSLSRAFHFVNENENWRETGHV